MPTFDFNVTQSNKSDGTGPVSATDTYTASGTTVTFTLSSTDTDGKQVQFGGTSGPFGIGLRDQGDDDVFTLRFQSTANTANIAISGNATNPITVGNGQFVIGTWAVSFLTAGGGVVAGGAITGGGQTVSNNALNNVTGIRFTSSNGSSAGSLEIDSLSFNAMVMCYCAGTRISTPDGWTSVEDLVEGDRVCTTAGTTTVKWLGKQTINTRLTHPAKINPVRIAAGALAEGLPTRDLFVSPDHAIYMDGMLINASALVNGATIIQMRDMPRDGFVYYHIETDCHELIFAEGCAAESFVDIPSRETFDNGAERADAPPIQEMDLPRITSKRLVPASVTAKIDDRAGTFLQLAG